MALLSSSLDMVNSSLTVVEEEQRDRLSLPEQYRCKQSVAPRFLRLYSKNCHAAVVRSLPMNRRQSDIRRLTIDARCRYARCGQFHRRDMGQGITGVPVLVALEHMTQQRDLAANAHLSAGACPR